MILVLRLSGNALLDKWGINISASLKRWGLGQLVSRGEITCRPTDVAEIDIAILTAWLLAIIPIFRAFMQTYLR